MIPHAARLSTSSLPKFGLESSKASEKKYETVKQLWSANPTPIPSRSHSRNPSTNEPTMPPAFGSPRSSVQSLDLKDLGDRLRRPRTSTMGSKYSSAICEPIVMHGWTLTSPVGFREVCVAIRETAFKTNPLPIIVSLEIHADMDQQEVMVEIMKEEWAGILLDRPNEECAPHQRQPRLEELLNKILIKVKKPSANTVPHGTNLAVVATPYDDDISASEDERDRDPSSKKQNVKVPICDSLSALAIYTHSSHFHSFDVPAAKTFGHIFSISETGILELHAAKPREMLAHNRNFFMRAFPNGRRVDSSNPPDPSQFWRKGVQMVALNWQCWDEGMILNDAMFAGSEGWVLKPRGYRSGDTRVASLLAPDNVTAHHHALDLKVTIYAGQHIPLPEARQKGDANTGVAVGVGSGSKRFRPYVKVEMIVERPEEGATKSMEGEAKAREAQYKMKTKPGETENPDWGKNGDCLSFPGIRVVVEELSFVR